MKTLYVNNNTEAYIKAMEFSPASLQAVEDAVYSFRVNLDRVHGPVLEEHSEAVEYVFECFYDDCIVNGAFIDTPMFNIGKYTRNCLREARRNSIEASLSLYAENGLISMIKAMYFVAKNRAVFLETNVQLKDIVSLK